MRPGRSSALLVAATLAALPARAQTTAREGATFLLLPVGARTVALGQAGVGQGGTTEALFMNPAGLADIHRTEIALHHYAFFAGIGDAFAVAMPARGLGTFSAAVYIVDYGETEVPGSPGGPPIGFAVPRNIALEAGYSTGLFGGLAAGIVYKLIQFRVDCSGSCPGNVQSVGTTHALDFGLHYLLPTSTPLELGLALRNVGFKLQVNNSSQADPLPTRLQVGLAWLILRPAPEVESFDVRLLADVQGTVGEGELSPATLLGVESGVRDMLRIRAGYAFIDSESNGPSLGLGVKVGRIGVDLAKTFYTADAIAEKDPFHVSVRFLF